jgi:hypothetical protein
MRNLNCLKKLPLLINLFRKTQIKKEKEEEIKRISLRKMREARFLLLIEKALLPLKIILDLGRRFGTLSFINLSQNYDLSLDNKFQLHLIYFNVRVFFVSKFIINIILNSSSCLKDLIANVIIK